MISYVYWQNQYLANEMYSHHPNKEIHETCGEEWLKHQELLLFWPYTQKEDHKCAMLANAFSEKHIPWCQVDPQ